jgi:hypothetical protein
MVMAFDDQAQLKALRNLISEAHVVLITSNLPEGRAHRAVELLDAAITSTDGLLTAEGAENA